MVNAALRLAAYGHVRITFEKFDVFAKFV